MHLLVLFPYWHSFVFLLFPCVCIFSAICVHFLIYILASLYLALLPTTITVATTTTTTITTTTTTITTTTKYFLALHNTKG